MKAFWGGPCCPSPLILGCGYGLRTVLSPLAVDVAFRDPGFGCVVCTPILIRFFCHVDVSRIHAVSSFVEMAFTRSTADSRAAEARAARCAQLLIPFESRQDATFEHRYCDQLDSFQSKTFVNSQILFTQGMCSCFKHQCLVMIPRCLAYPRCTHPRTKLESPRSAVKCSHSLRPGDSETQKWKTAMNTRGLFPAS